MLLPISFTYQQPFVPSIDGYTTVRNSIKRVEASSGLIVQIPINTIAFDFNATGDNMGVLSEQSVVNQLLRSEDFTTTWTNQGSTDTANTDIAPTGNQTADTVTGDGTNTSVYVQQSITVSGAGAYSFSVFAKAGTHNTIRLSMANYAGGSGNTIGFDLTNGTFTGGTNGRIDAYPNGWYRCIMYYTIVGGDVAGQARINISKTAGTNNWDTAADSNGKSVLLWGAQLELLQPVSSYISTVGSTVTRLDDVISKTSATNDIGQTEGSVIVDFTHIQINSARALFRLSNGTSGVRIGFTISAANVLNVVVNGSSGIFTGITLTNGRHVAAFTYTNSKVAYFLDGVKIQEVATDGSGAYSQINIGSSETGTSQIGNPILSSIVLKTALTDQQAINYTTL
jgi:hypothetical protein